MYACNTDEVLYKLATMNGAVAKPQFELEAMITGFTRRVYEGILAQALDDSTPDNLRLYQWSVYNPHGRALAAISRAEQPLEETHSAVKETKERERKAAKLAKPNASDAKK